MAQTPIVAIGASAGSLDVIKKIVKALPDGFPGAVFVVQHIAPDSKSYLPEILAASTPLRVMHARDGGAIRPSHVYCMVPDRHLLLGKDTMYVRHGRAENRFRPSIDAMFRSAAYNHGSALIGVVVSGALSDGTTGLWTIKLLGGTAIVQNPEEALFPSMPRSALAEVDIDHCARSDEIGPLIVHLVTTMKPNVTRRANDSVRARLKRELQITAGDVDFTQ